MTLDQVRKGQQFIIRAINNEMIRVQAVRCGISEGTLLTLQEVVPAGPVVVKWAKQEIAIGRNLAKNINVDLIQ